jgi:Flp pilus assembly protein TadG
MRRCDGNVSIMYALMAPVLILGAGAAIDYGRTAQIHSKLDGAADAAVLAALTPAMLQQSDTTAQTAAQNMFTGLADGISGLSGTTLNVSVTQSTNPLQRNVTLNYATSVNALFAGVTGKTGYTMSGSAQGSAQIPPNINFYVLLDNSPSMALPATSAGITQMQNLTSKQDGNNGCAFACHQASTNNGDSAGNPCADGTAPTLDSSMNTASPAGSGIYCDTTKHGAELDNYALARKKNITLRLDELNTGVSTLLQTASTTASSSSFSPPPKYQFAIYSMDSLWQIGLTQLMPLTSNYVSGWTTASANFGVMEMWKNNNNCANSSCSSGTSSPGGDVATNYDDSLGKLNTSTSSSYIPNPGNGTNQPGDTPQEVLFIVTDGVEDEENGGRIEQAINDYLGVSGTSAPDGKSNSTNWCTTIKNRGIKIAILYTEYLPIPANSYYVGNIEPFQPDIGPALQACASPNLFYDAAIGADLGQALSALFNAVTQSGHLTN